MEKRQLIRSPISPTEGISTLITIGRPGSAIAVLYCLVLSPTCNAKETSSSEVIPAAAEGTS